MPNFPGAGGIGGGDGGSSTPLGEELPNVFTGATKLDAETARDNQAIADPAWLQYYNDNLNANIRLDYQDGGNPEALFQVRSSTGTSWLDNSTVVGIPGEPGADGATGNSYFFSSEPARDLFFGTAPNEGLLEKDLPIIVFDNDAATIYYWSGETDPNIYDELLWRPSALRTSPGTVFLGGAGTSISSGNHLLNFVDADGELSYLAKVRFDDTGSEDPRIIKLGARIPAIISNIGGTTLNDPQQFQFNVTLSSMKRSYTVVPASPGTLRIQSYYGTTENDPVILDFDTEVLIGEIGIPKEIELPNSLYTVDGDQILLVLSGIKLEGGLQTSGEFNGLITPVLTNDIQLGEERFLVFEDDLGDVNVTTRGIDFEDSHNLQVAGESIFDVSKVSGEMSRLLSHPDNIAKAFDRSLLVDIPQNNIPIFTINNGIVTNPVFEFVNTLSDMQLFNIEVQSDTAQTNVEFIIREDGVVVYRAVKASIPAGVFFISLDDASQGNVVCDLRSGGVYSWEIRSDDGDVRLLGNTGNQAPLMAISYIAYKDEELAYNSQIIPTVETTVNGVNFGEAMNIQTGGDCLFQSNNVTNKIGAVLNHDIENERTLDRSFRLTQKVDDAPVFTVQSATLLDPSFLFAPADNVRLTDIQLKTGGLSSSDVVFKIRDAGTNIVIWESLIDFMSANSTVRIDFVDTSLGNVPVDLFDSVPYSFELTSTGTPNVQLLGNSGTDQPWMTVSFFPFFDETVAYVSDLDGFDGIYHVDINTSIPLAEQDGSLFRPYAGINQTLAAIGNAGVSNQHTLVINHGQYNETVTLPVFTHLISKGQDGQSVDITQVNVEFIGGSSSITNIRANMVVYDTSADVTASTTKLTLTNVGINGGLSVKGRGAGSDQVEVIDIAVHGGFSPIQNCKLCISFSDPSGTIGGMAITADIDGVNLLDGFSTVVELDTCKFGDAGIISITPLNDTSMKFKVINSQLPSIFTSIAGTAFVDIERDSLSFIASITDLGLTSNLDLLSKAKLTDFDRSGSKLVSEDANAAILEVFNLIDTPDTPVINGTWSSPGNANITPKPIIEVENINGVPRFKYGVIPLEPVEYQEVILTGFVANPSYNGTHIVTNAGPEFFDLGALSFGTDEIVGSFSAIATTFLEIDTVLSPGDSITMDTFGESDEYDGTYTVFGVGPDAWRITRQVGSIKQGTWSARPISQNTSSIVRDGSLDSSPPLLSVETGTTFGLTGADFGYILEPVIGQKEIRTSLDATGIDLTTYQGQDWRGISGTVFVYVDVNQQTPMVALSFNTFENQPRGYVYVGNLDLETVVTPFDTLFRANRVIYTAYDAGTALLLASTKQNYSLVTGGLIFNGGATADRELGITAGRAVRIGANTANDYRDPDVPPANPANSISTLNRQYIKDDGTTVTIAETGGILTVNEYYDRENDAVIPLQANRFQIMYLYIFPLSWAARATMGDTVYNTIADAERDVINNPPGQSNQTREALLTTAVIVRSDTVSLLDLTKVKFKRVNN